MKAARRRRDPLVVVCAWCRLTGQPTIAVRGATSREWQSVSFDSARAFKAAGIASHGICSSCAEIISSEWDLEREQQGAKG